MATAIIYAPSGGSTSMFEIAVPVTANSGLLSVGPGPWDGLSAGHFAGSSSGTGLALNLASGFTGNPLDIQVAGVSFLSVSSNGSLTVRTDLIQGLGGGGLKFGLFNNSSGQTFEAGGPNVVPLNARGYGSQTSDLQQWLDSVPNVQFGVSNAGTGGAPIWALRVRRTSAAESMAQTHTLGAYSGRSVQVLDDTGATVGWIPIYA